MNASTPDLPGARAIDLGSDRVWLLPDRAVWIAEHRALLIGDVHLGRVLEAEPSAERARLAARADLAAIDALERRLGAERTIVLGDLRHAPAPTDQLAAANDELAARAERPGATPWWLVRGNQDERTGDPPRDWGIETVDQGYRLGVWTLLHHPVESRPRARPHGSLPRDEPQPDGAWISGHLHPGIGAEHVARSLDAVEATSATGRQAAAGADAPERSTATSGDAPVETLPAFLLEGRGLVVPAFGRGARAHPPRRRPRQLLLPIVDGRVGEPRPRP